MQDLLCRLGAGWTFSENAINEKILPDLTAEDLKDMGIGIVGHRQMLLDAIAALHIGADAKASPLPTAPVAAASTPEAACKRRRVTVMFCHLVDSTGIAAKLDAEEWRDLVGAYLDTASTAVTEMGGTRLLRGRGDSRLRGGRHHRHATKADDLELKAAGRHHQVLDGRNALSHETAAQGLGVRNQVGRLPARCRSEAGLGAALLS